MEEKEKTEEKKGVHKKNDEPEAVEKIYRGKGK